MNVDGRGRTQALRSGGVGMAGGFLKNEGISGGRGGKRRAGNERTGRAGGLENAECKVQNEQLWKRRWAVQPVS